MKSRAGNLYAEETRRGQTRWNLGEGHHIIGKNPGAEFGWHAFAGHRTPTSALERGFRSSYVVDENSRTEP